METKKRQRFRANHDESARKSGDEKERKFGRRWQDGAEEEAETTEWNMKNFWTSGDTSESHVGVRGQARTVADCKICNNSSHSVQHPYCGIRVLFQTLPQDNYYIMQFPPSFVQRLLFLFSSFFDTPP